MVVLVLKIGNTIELTQFEDNAICSV